MQTKKEIRNLVQKQKEKFTPEFEKEAEEKCFQKVTALQEWKEADFILIYISFNHEMGTSRLIWEAFQRGKKIASPKVEGRNMKFYQYSSYEELEKSKIGIYEPVPNMLPIPEDALLIMPGVAFDEEKNRIGYGGGYYDNYLSKHPNHKIIAIAYESQIFQKLPSEDHDVRPDYIVTEERII